MGAAAVLILAFAVPMGASAVVAALIHVLIPRPATMGLRVAWWATQIAASAIAFVVVERLSRRFLPLAALLRMTLVFPDQAPSRLAVARRAARTKDLDRRIDQAMQTGQRGSLDDAAQDILALAAALSVHDRRTRGHSERVRVVTDMLADELELAPHDRDRLRWSALLHDVGKLTVHPHILNKSGKLNALEWATLQRHPIEGARLTAPLLGWLGPWALAVEQHHENFDGSGYPYGLAGADISFGARVVAVADVFETMTAKRSYKDAVSPAMARRELTRCAGTQFDPDIVRAFLNISLGRVRWAVGPASLLAQLPFLGQLPFIGGQTSGALAAISPGASIGVAALSVSSIVMGQLPATSASIPTPPPAIATGLVSTPHPSGPEHGGLAGGRRSPTSSSPVLAWPVGSPVGSPVATAAGPAAAVTAAPGPAAPPTPVAPAASRPTSPGGAIGPTGANPTPDDPARNNPTPTTVAAHPASTTKLGHNNGANGNVGGSGGKNANNSNAHNSNSNSYSANGSGGTKDSGAKGGGGNDKKSGSDKGGHP
jgi:HD-GYP domain-containing protein (c-di-GMP phosphodiesterase class II)